MVNVTGEPMRLRGEEVNVAPPQVPVREDVPVRTAALSAEEKERLYDEAEAAINRYLAGGRPIRISFRPRKRAAPDDVTEEAPLAEGPSAQTAQREPKRSKRTKVAASASDVQPEVPDSSIQADTSCDEERIMEEAEEIQSEPPAMSSPQSVSIEAKIEEEAQPRLPMNMINSQEAELKEIQREKATKASQSQECKEKADQHKSRSASLRDELVSLSEQRQKAWEEYQRLSALHSEKERLLREEEEEESKAKAAMEGLDKEVAELESRSVVAEETLSRLRSNPVIDSRAQAEATLAVSRAIKLKDEGDTGASPK